MRILLAVDGSEVSAAAARQLTARPWPRDTQVKVLSVVRPVPMMGDPFMVAPTVLDEQMMRPIAQRAEELANEVARSLRGAGLQAEPVTVRGDPRAEIVEHARKWGADLVVVGSHGRTGLPRWLLGSVAEYVVRHAPCSVEVVRAAHKPAADEGKEGTAR